MAMTIGMIVVVIVVLLVLFVRWHVNWLAQQSPAGSWTAHEDPASITLVFEGGPLEGTYKQVVESEGKTIREFGHWASHLTTLRMLIMATDVPGHSRFGIDTSYAISYVGPDSIRINGADRPNLLFTRTREPVTIDFSREQEPS
ncbi:MAG: hypothetical protein GXY83_39240 [Rhodopirellula sp.]|nr:hypothetical protein [Rhodopirellula sp.]